MNTDEEIKKVRFQLRRGASIHRWTACTVEMTDCFIDRCADWPKAQLEDQTLLHLSQGCLLQMGNQVSLLPPGLPPRTFACTVLLSYSVFDFDFFSLFFVSGPCARLRFKLAISSAFERT